MVDRYDIEFVNGDTKRFYKLMKSTDDYWLNMDRLSERFPNVWFRPIIGVSATMDDEGNRLLPHRDLRHHVLYTEDALDEYDGGDAWQLGDR